MLDDMDAPETATTLCCCCKMKSIDLEETSTSGGKYKAYNYDIILYFGGPELKTQMCWMDEVNPVIPFLCECLWPI